HLVDRLLGVELAELQVERRGEFPQVRRDLREHSQRETMEAHESNPPGQGITARAQVRLRLFQRGEDVLGLGNELPRRIGEDDTPADGLEQTYAGLLLHPAPPLP